MPSKFFTNKKENTLLSKFDEVFKNNPSICHFDILIGYLRASGYFQLRPLLDKVSEIRILVGMDIDNLLSESHKKAKDLFTNSEVTKEQFEKSILSDLEKAKYNQITIESIEQFFEDIKLDKLKIRVHPSRKLHAKIYIFTPENFTEKTFGGAVITGSSNLTYAALNTNYEFNVQLNEPDDVWFAKQEFETLWAEAEGNEVASNQTDKIKENSFLKEITPFELYIKLLIEFFGKNVEYNPNIIGDLPDGYKKLSYQLDAVSQGFEMLIKHNGFFLADVVGLGKTIIATMIAKKFWLQNGVEKTKILVVYPPAMESSWKEAFKDFGLKTCTDFITNGSLNKILDKDKNYSNPTEYDLIIVDEAHKFRSHTTDSYEYLQRICKSKRCNLGNIAGTKKVMLISATPLNNSPLDLQNQIELFQDSKQSTLPITNLTKFFSPLIEDYKKIKAADKLDIDELRNIYKKIRKNVIEPITIRRTRKDLENTPEYIEDLKKQEITFPRLHAPQKKEYSLNLRLTELFEKTIEYLLGNDKLNYSRYQAISFLKPDIKEKYYDRAEMTSKSLAFIMKTNLIKRLESSFDAFKISLETFINATKRMIEMFGNNKIYIVPDGDIMKMLEKGLTEKEIDEKIKELEKKNNKNQIFEAKDFDSIFRDKLQSDLSLLTELHNAWKNENEDPKFDVFLKCIKKEFLDKKINEQGKLVVFSESEDTINYLDEKLKNSGENGVLKISAKNRKQMEQTIKENFDAKFDIEKQKNYYNIILTTEVLAEGVNLHRSNIVVHYDTPWNSVKLMQRVGRVNRIGGSSKDIYNFVFYPSLEGDKQINLKKTAIMKIQGFHSAFGEDNQVFSEEEILDEVKLFSENAFREEETEILKYLIFLREFKKDNLKLFNEISNYPKKIRVGRVANNENLKETTLVFLKTDEKSEFYFVNNNEAKEITVIDAFKIAKAEKTEVSTNLSNNHYEHIELAERDFKEQEGEIVRSVNELKGKDAEARKFVLDMLKDSNPELTNKLAKLIEIGKVKDITAKILKIKNKKNMNYNELLLELERLSEGLDLFDTKELKKEIKEPDLILSESFTE